MTGLHRVWDKIVTRRSDAWFKPETPSATRRLLHVRRSWFGAVI